MTEATPPQRRSTGTTMDQCLHFVRTCSTAKLKALCRHHFGADYARLPTSYIDSLCSGNHRTLSHAGYASERPRANALECGPNINENLVDLGLATSPSGNHGLSIGQSGITYSCSRMPWPPTVENSRLSPMLLSDRHLSN